jgi:anti-sigma factor RsiW
MTPIGCAATRRAAPELALDVLDGAERAEALHHVARCPRCLAYVAELAQVSDQLVGLAPDLEPPPRFAHRVIGQITSRRRHTNWRWAAAITATAATVILVIAATGILTRSAAHPVSAPPLRSVVMLAPGAITVGQVVVSGVSPAQMAVNIHSASCGTLLRTRGSAA